MGKRIQRVMVGVMAMSALALGGAVFAQAQSSPSNAREHATAPDRDHVQSGDRTPRERSSATDGDSVQSGDQSTPDRPGGGGRERPAAESPEQPGESAANGDGPGGHADEPGHAGADHQFQGTE